MADGVAEFVGDGDSQELRRWRREGTLEFGSTLGVRKEKDLLEKRRAFSEGGEGRAALIEVKAEQERLPIFGAHDDPAPRTRLGCRIVQQDGS